MRHVFPTSEVPHKWAHATQEDARNPGGNLYFRGDTIYSYRDSWPLARIFRHPKRGALVLTNCGRYSVTTSDPQHAVNSAVSHLPQIAVPFPLADKEWAKTAAETHRLNVAHLEKRAADALAKSKRALQSRSVEWNESAAREFLADAARYLEFFGIRRKAAAFPAAEWAAARARVQRIQNPDPASADKRERASARRKVRAEEKRRRDAELAAVRDMARRTDWRLFGAFGAGRPDYGGLCMLRVDGEEIETSQGARIPLAAAPMVWAMVERQRAKGTDYAPQRGLGAGPKIGDYAISRIGGDGALVVGCHDIPHGELRQMARQLGLEVRP